MATTVKRSYGCIKSKVDHTCPRAVFSQPAHLKLGAPRARAGPSTTIFDLRRQVKLPQAMSEIDQGQLGSCTANAIAFAVCFDELKQRNKAAFMPSRLFIYYNERVMEGTVSQDAGAEIHDGVKSLNIYGYCSA